MPTSATARRRNTFPSGYRVVTGSQVLSSYIGKHDVAQANSSLAQAGYPNGFSTSYMYIAGNSPASDRFAQVLKSQFGAVGSTSLSTRSIRRPTSPGWVRRTTAWPSTSIRTSPTRCSTSSPRPPRNGPVPDAIQSHDRSGASATKNADYLQTIRALSLTEDELGFPNFVVASPTQFVAYRRNVSNVKLDFSISWLFLTKVIKH